MKYAKESTPAPVEKNDIKQIDFFCPMPFVSADISASGEFGYCCEAPPLFAKNSHLDLEQLFNSTEIKQIRNIFLQNATPIGCKKCAQQEKISHQSKRLRELNRYLKGQYGPLIEADKMREDSTLRFLNYRLGNLCNLKCLMCNPGASHLIAFEENNFTGAATEYINENHLIFKKELLSISSIYFGGGEPFLSSSFKQTLDFFVSNDKRDVDILMNSNLTTLPNQTIELLKKFKSVYIGVSIDGFQESFEYIRFPHKWKTLLSNVQKILETTDFDIGFHVTLSCLNISSLCSIVQFVAGLKKQSLLKIDLLTEPQEQSLFHLNATARQQYKNSLEETLLLCQKNLCSFSQESVKNVILALQSGFVEDQSFKENLFSFLNKKDQIRGTSYMKSLPQIVTDLC